VFVTPPPSHRVRATERPDSAPPARTTPAQVEIARVYTFDAAHQLHWHSGKCARLHGHTYTLSVVISGRINENGVIMDFDDLDKIVSSAVLDSVDHQHLNQLIDNPTVENVAGYIWSELDGEGLRLSELSLWETPRSWARLRA
jgi:6-pyruvoyltetrahydropterin/6-carboxytetrahydropterin synthase